MQNWILFLLNFHAGHGKNINILMSQLFSLINPYHNMQNWVLFLLSLHVGHGKIVIYIDIFIDFEISFCYLIVGLSQGLSNQC